MCRSNVIIYQNETKFEIYCNENRKPPYHRIKMSGDKHHNLGMDSHSLYILWLSGGIVNVEKIYCDYFSCDFFFLWLFFLWFFSYLSSDFLSCDIFFCDFFSVYHLCIVYIISHLLEEMYENQISVLLKFHVLPRKDKLLSASVIFGS